MVLRAIRFLVLAAVLIAFGVFVWPSRWRYDKMTVGEDTYPVRIDRISGHAYILLPGDGWTPAEDATDLDNSGQDEAQPNKT